jgi:hypothetical protein
MCDLIFSGVFERHPRLTLAIVELAWAPHLLSTMDYTYRERHGEAIYPFKDGMLASDFFRRNVVLSFQEDAIGIRPLASLTSGPPQRASIPVLALEAQPPTGLPSRPTCRGAGPLQVLKTRGF